MKASELLLQSAEPFDKACMMVREMELEIERLRELVETLHHFVPHNHNGVDCAGCAMDARIAAALPPNV